MGVGKAFSFQALNDIFVTEQTAILTLCDDVCMKCELLLHLSLRFTNSVSYVLLRSLSNLDKPFITSRWVLR